MSINSRQKGAQFERAIAKELLAETGITFKRDLRQYQENERGDLVPSDDGFPFVIECKARATGGDCLPAWEIQAQKAAAAEGKYPAVIWKFNNKPVRVRIWLDAMAEAVGGSAVTTQHCDLSVQGFAWVAREIMAGRAA